MHSWDACVGVISGSPFLYVKYISSLRCFFELLSFPFVTNYMFRKWLGATYELGRSKC